MTGNPELVSIVIPMFNEEKNAGRCLEALTRQTYANIEIIVIDDGSIDKTCEIASKYTKQVFSTRRKGISSAKNLGLKIARGRFVAFTDADCVSGEGWIEELMKCFFDDNIASAGGPNLNLLSEDMSSKSVDGFFYFLRYLGFTYVKKEDKPCYVRHNPGCNVIYRKEILKGIGFFNERLITAEDEELDYRITKSGYKIFFTPDAKVRHLRKRSLSLFSRQMYRYSVGKMQLIRLHRELSRPLFFIPCSLLIISAALFILPFFLEGFFIFSRNVFILGLFSVFLTAFYMGLLTGPRLIPFYLFLVPAACLSCGAGFLRGIFKKI